MWSVGGKTGGRIELFKVVPAEAYLAGKAG